MRRRTWLLLAGLLALAVIGDTVLWQVAINRLERGFDAWAAAGAASNFSITRGKAKPGGWPFAATLRISDVTTTGGDTLTPDGATWFAKGMVLRVSIRHPRSLEIELQGEQRLHAGAMPDISLLGDRLLAIVSLGWGDEPDSVDILLDRPRLVSTTAWTTEAERIRIHTELPGSNRFAASKFAFSAENVVLPDSATWPLGRFVTRLDFDGTIDGPITVAPSAAAWFAAWRDGGGSCQLQNLLLLWGPLRLNAAATLALDDQLQPMGAGTARVAGYGATLDAFAQHGALSHSAATAAKAVLSLLAGSPADGDPEEVEVPLTLQYRTLSMRQVPLARLPELDWPGQ
jgi:hypothetical protein